MCSGNLKAFIFGKNGSKLLPFLFPKGDISFLDKDNQFFYRIGEKECIGQLP